MESLRFARQGMDIPPEVVAGLNRSIEEFRELLWGETPMRIHQRGLDQGGAPQWHPEFAAWIKAEPAHHVVQEAYADDQRLRTTRVLRKLRRKAPREFDVIFLLTVRRPPLSITEVTHMLNERAERIGKPERYQTGDILILAIAGMDKASRWW